MASTFGSATQQFPLDDPRLVRHNRERFRRDDIPELALANSLWIANGMSPARGFILMRRGDYDNLNPYSTSLQLTLDALDGSKPLTFKNLTVVQAQCVSRGIAADPDASYLVELTDLQGIIWNRWAQFPTNSAYNTRAPAYPQKYYSASLQGGTAVFSWDAMCQDLWQQMPLLGPWPGLPVAITGSPEGFVFPGVPAWEALNHIFDLLGLDVATDLTKTSPYTIIQGGATDLVFIALQILYSGQLADDLEYIDTGSGRVPAQVIVYFHRRNDQYGTEETVRRDALQWSSTPLYQVSVAAPATFSGAAGTAYLWGEFTLRYDVDGNPLAADVATANTIAAERAAQYFQRIYRQTSGFMRQTYHGVVPFATGSLVDGVCWREDFRRREGFVTDIIRGPEPAWKIMMDMGEAV